MHRQHHEYIVLCSRIMLSTHLCVCIQSMLPDSNRACPALAMCPASSTRGSMHNMPLCHIDILRLQIKLQTHDFAARSSNLEVIRWTAHVVLIVSERWLFIFGYTRPFAVSLHHLLRPPHRALFLHGSIEQKAQFSTITPETESHIMPY